MHALISVSDKIGIVAFAQELVSLGYTILSTGGTLKILADNGVPVTAVDAVTKFPEMMDGRLKTLHPNIHGGLLARRNLQSDLDSCKKYGIPLIDLVVVNLYPFEKTILNPDSTFQNAIENIDIGGPTMIRSAAKNQAFVGVVVNPDRYTTVVESLKQNGGKLPPRASVATGCRGVFPYREIRCCDRGLFASCARKVRQCISFSAQSHVGKSV